MSASSTSIATIYLFFLLYTIYLSVHSPYQKPCQCYYGNSNELAPSLAQPWFVTILSITRLVFGISFGRFRNHILNPLLCLHFRSWSIFPPLRVGLEEFLVLLLQFLPHCGGNDWFDVCMLREGFHALFLAHVKYDTLFDQVVHHAYIWSWVSHDLMVYLWYTTIYIRSNTHAGKARTKRKWRQILDDFLQKN